MALKFKTVATGGTFDHLHRGHLALLTKSFEVGDRVVIGVTSDEFAEKEGKVLDQKYEVRVDELRGAIATLFPGRDFLIAKLEDYFGPGIASPEVEAIVVTRETSSRVPMANKMRREKGYPPLQTIVIDYVMADDHSPISSSRIKKGEIDAEGRVLRN